MPSEVSETPARPGGPLRVFLVDDMVHVRQSMVDLLASCGPFALVAERATEAEAKLWLHEHHGAWDLVIIDLVLAQGTGMGVIAAARASAPAGAIVVFSDFATPGIRRHCHTLGADQVFQKSTDLPALAAFAEALIARLTPR